MKVREQKRRLRVARETLRVLGHGALAEVAGGDVPLPKSTAWTGANDDDTGRGAMDRSCTGA